MAHKLAVIAATGIAGLAVCLGAAAAINGGNLSNGFDNMDFGMFDGKPRCEIIAGANATSRDLDWDGSDHADIGIPAQTSYTPGGSDKLHITGNAQILAHMKVEDGTITLDCRPTRQQRMKYRDDASFHITLPGRAFRKFSIAGGGKLTLDKLQQDDLKVEIAGAGTILANGVVDKFRIEIAGSGNADFGKVEARDAGVEIAGSGKADIAPSDTAKVEIAGSGDVYLHSNPKHLDTEVAGSGSIHRLAGGGS
jgi:hypothetical protein